MTARRTPRKETSYGQASIGRYRRTPSTVTHSVKRTTGGPKITFPRNKPVKLTKSVMENVFGMLNPHAATNPRIMDGAVSCSQTHVSRIVQNAIINSGTSYTIFLTPDLMCPLSSLNGINAAHYTNNLDDVNWSTTGMPAGTTAGSVGLAGEIERWRVVSQGLKISLLNATDSNDGMFRAYRIHAKPAGTDYHLFEASGARGCLRPDNAILTEYTNAAVSTATNKPSFGVAALKDIDKYYFSLNPMGAEHPFNVMPQNVEVTASAAYDAGAGTWSAGLAGLRGYQQMFNAQHDSYMDMICIVVTPGSGGSTLLLDMVQNLEVVYDHNSTLARYHTATQNNERIAKAVQIAQQKRQSAATPQAQIKGTRLSYGLGTPSPPPRPMDIGQT